MSIEDRKAIAGKSRLIWRGGLLVFGLATSVVIYVQQQFASEESERQSKKDIAEAVSPLQKGMNKLISQIADLSKKTIAPTQAKGVIVVVPKVMPQIVTAHPVKESQSGPIATPAPSVAHVSFAQRQVTSSNQEYPYEYQVVLQTNVAINQPHFAVVGDSPIGRTRFFVAGQGVLMNVSFGTVTGNPDAAELSFGFPEFTPDHPIIVTVATKQPWKAIKIDDLRGSP